ncbi:geranylgeranylglyceryl/heptaprenylglyceryl phosphate synthase [Flammeovirga yaeyamensis]|uniref:Geranylgeranylglyceryl phosphate synthase n=1 Tax=Flammeovirga yaeyamensis TaxID=367791 RepID=A0AAX1MYG2_9BACT|nr:MULTISPECIES: geranylgeranylglyceryl/heptaprenylglyceryl phosphate synthase [Flammeovirga]ANQ48471.1 geranylgeranylglyceryl/heptaprenylglyceryl phosphate synthase [Flammeovirga sp. MY04]MBB3696375.1 putative glycerol-1-phosphate prenyltransferase [Flammeovirga yaeyamensis]NMF35054.1 geranylgeranylglyceryl/heptaprenylglyceryl phosphate synthase [Flammeovirga yaeyamensis]QWG00122.1 geranylgeranylglyceryl/heptaprenylglyceryl phosphate synthase [Flammeovirga yaeyamensis]
MQLSIENWLLERKSELKRTLAILIDPDKWSNDVYFFLKNGNKNHLPDIFLVGGSLLSTNQLEKTVKDLKSLGKPVVLFPGNSMQVTKEADAILFMSLISGRNPEFLIGQQVHAAHHVKESKLEAIPLGYVLIDTGVPTSVQYMSNTQPIPYNKEDIAISTVMAGELLGMRAFYLEGGSGASKTVSNTMIKGVKEKTDSLLFVGGGIRSKNEVVEKFEAGADIVVIGSAFEKNQSLLKELYEELNVTI